MNIMKKISILIVCFVCAFAEGQTTKEQVTQLLKEVQGVYDGNTSFELTTQYELFKGENGKEVLESYDGNIVKNGSDSYNRINTTEFFQIGTHSIKVNHDQKKARYQKVDVSKTPVVDIANMLTFFVGREVKETSDAYICTLTSSSITPMPYGKVILHIDKQSKRIKKQILHYLTKKPFPVKGNKEEWDTPRLEITYTNFSTDVTAYLEKFNIKNFMSFKDDRAISAGLLEGYKIVK